MNDIEFVFEIEDEAGSLIVPMYFSAHEWFDYDSGDIPEVHYTDIGFDQRQKDIIHDLIRMKGTEHDGGLLSAMQNAYNLGVTEERAKYEQLNQTLNP